MFKNAKEVKSFIEWAKSLGASEVTVKDVSIVFNPILQATESIDEHAKIPGTEDEPLPGISHLDTKTLMDTDSESQSDSEFEKLLYHSSNS